MVSYYLLLPYFQIRMKATLQRPKPTFKKPSWQGDNHMLGVRRGFIGKNYGDREPHPNRFRHLGPERRPYSNHSNYPGSRIREGYVGRLPPMAVDDGERPVSVREYRSYYRRDSTVPGWFLLKNVCSSFFFPRGY